MPERERVHETEPNEFATSQLVRDHRVWPYWRYGAVGGSIFLVAETFGVLSSIVAVSGLGGQLGLVTAYFKELVKNNGDSEALPVSQEDFAEISGAIAYFTTVFLIGFAVATAVKLAVHRMSPRKM